MNIKWERLFENKDKEFFMGTYRTPVPDGWIVLNRTLIIYEDKADNISESMIFVPDPLHEWEI